MIEIRFIEYLHTVSIKILDSAGDARRQECEDRSQESEVRSQKTEYVAAADKNIDWIYYA
jgi:hypothetical protein